MPRIGAFNLHGSLLPHHRGAAPVAYAILAGDQTAGVTLFRIEKGLDSGPIVAIASTPIEPRETAGELERRLSALGGEADRAVSPRVRFGRRSKRRPRTTRRRRSLQARKGDGAARLEHARCEGCGTSNSGLQPWPGAFTFLEREGTQPERTVILRGEVGDSSPPAGANPGRRRACGRRRVRGRLSPRDPPRASSAASG